ncbi:Atypical/ABC1 protein kinase [Polytolypa hystricis UAMH7299]|uniref:Atypical/ABC1 protein kinase n=1 Tax=Polytolypa hystricis (strain UAMH7299) TaxID=1447883 RepID=A0A2B7Y032_POLH7|nr:Atypical/ABC1 protein kinase [Polytolypa hystricis UAMH7299]
MASSRRVRSLLSNASQHSVLTTQLSTHGLRRIPPCAAPTSRIRSRCLTWPPLNRAFHSREFQPFVPPPPSSLPKAAPPKTYHRTLKWLRRLLYLSLTGGLIYTVDRYYYASCVKRTVRTFALGALAALDYKINFRPNPPFASSIAAVHARNAERLSNLLRDNGGLYLKIGQAIAMQSAIFPPEFQKMFAGMFDDAPQDDWRDVERVIVEDFGRPVEEVFGVSFTGDPNSGVMERTARASASVAQVHWARLKDGREIAIKIQKRGIAQQVKWDLWAFQVLAYVYSRTFDIPFYSLVPFVNERLYLETDFENEANNCERMAELVASEPRLRNRVYIPKVYRELSSRRVMTAEWIEGVRLWDKDSLTRPWRGGWGQGSPGCHGTPLDATNPSPSRAVWPSNSRQENLKPARDHWKGRGGRGGLGLSLKDVMGTMVDLFSAQMFLWGWLHCDPHPGNVIIRRKPNGKAEIVLIDHGLYIHMRPDFRHQYARFWKALLTFDNASLSEIVKSWGVTNPDIFASATLMRPYKGGDMSTSKGLEGLSKTERAQRHYEMQQAMRKAARDFLGDETKWPRELIFISRNLRIVQANNQFLGSPVNRIKITGLWASRALVESPDLPLPEKIKNFGRHIVFRLVLLSSDIVFWISKIKQFLGRGRGMEDEIEAQMQSMAREMGVELNQNIFEG